MSEKLDERKYGDDLLELCRITSSNFVGLCLKHTTWWGGYVTRAVKLWLDPPKVRYVVVRMNYNGTGADPIAEQVLMPHEAKKLYELIMSIKTISEFYDFVETYF
jgi:hypothetical protein